MLSSPTTNQENEKVKLNLKNPPFMSFTSISTTATRFETSDNMPAYMKSVQLYEVLAKEDELALGRRIQKGLSIEANGPEKKVTLTDDAQEALDMLVNANLRFVVQQANKFIGQGVKIDDLIQEGNEGLIKAALKYDPNQNKKFITFAHFYLQKAFNTANGTYGKIVRLPMNQEYDIYKKRMAGEEINTHSVQLDRPIGENGENTVGDLILRTDPNETIEQDHNRFIVTTLMSRLDKVSKTVIELRFGMTGEEELSVKEVAERLNMSTDEVGKIYRKAIRTMKPAS